MAAVCPRTPAAGTLRLLLVALVCSCCLLLACRDAGPAHSIVLITIDTLRADHLHVYGHPEALSPNVDALAARGVLFTRAVAASAATAPSHATLFTSRHARHHSIGPRNGDTRLEGARSMARLLRENGYATAAFVGNAVLTRAIGLDDGFDVYDDELPSAEANRPDFFERDAEATTRRALSWLETARRPFFLWVHYQDPHGPYTPPDAFLERLPAASAPDEALLPMLDKQSGRNGIPAYQALDGEQRPSEYRRRYAAEVLYADHWIGELLDRLAPGTKGDPGPAVILTADHGESLGEESFWFQHGGATTPALSHVPLILAAPGLTPARRAQLVHHVDVLPTVLELARVDPPAELEGVSLMAAARNDAALPDRVVFCDIPGMIGAYRGDEIVRYRVEYTPLPGTVRSRGHRWAPAQPLAPMRPSVELVHAAGRYLESAIPTVPLELLPKEQEERLRALGYLEPEDETPEP